MWMPALGWVRCPYGRISEDVGPTRRARKFSTWIHKHKDKHPGVPTLGYPAHKMALVGDFVYLPYVYMNMNEAAPFEGHSGLFCKGTCLIPKDNWTVDLVCCLLDFHPRDLMGRVITSYQEKEVPLFLMHLREVDCEMWQQLIVRCPELDVVPDHTGRKAILKTLAHPIEWNTGHEGYPVCWRWDGKQLMTTSPSAYSSIWGKVTLSELTLTGVPADDAVVKVRSNDWVTGDTIFID